MLPKLDPRVGARQKTEDGTRGRGDGPTSWLVAAKVAAAEVMVVVLAAVVNVVATAIIRGRGGNDQVRPQR